MKQNKRVTEKLLKNFSSLYVNYASKKKKLEFESQICQYLLYEQGKII